MRSFIENYLDNQSDAIVKAAQETSARSWMEKVDDGSIYDQLDSPCFKLYETMILCSTKDDFHYICTYD